MNEMSSTSKVSSVRERVIACLPKKDGEVDLEAVGGMIGNDLARVLEGHIGSHEMSGYETVSLLASAATQSALESQRSNPVLSLMSGILRNKVVGEKLASLLKGVMNG